MFVPIGHSSWWWSHRVWVCEHRELPEPSEHCCGGPTQRGSKLMEYPLPSQMTSCSVKHWDQKKWTLFTFYKHLQLICTCTFIQSSRHRVRDGKTFEAIINNCHPGQYISIFSTTLHYSSMWFHFLSFPPSSRNHYASQFSATDNQHRWAWLHSSGLGEAYWGEWAEPQWANPNRTVLIFN